MIGSAKWMAMAKLDQYVQYTSKDKRAKIM